MRKKCSVVNVGRKSAFSPRGKSTSGGVFTTRKFSFCFIERTLWFSSLNETAHPVYINWVIDKSRFRVAAFPIKRHTDDDESKTHKMNISSVSYPKQILVIKGT